MSDFELLSIVLMVLADFCRKGGQLMSDFELLSIVLMVLAIIIPLLLEVIKTQKK